MISAQRREFWQEVGLAAVLAALVAVPIAMGPVMARMYELPKFLIAEPPVILAVVALWLAGTLGQWRQWLRNQRWPWLALISLLGLQLIGALGSETPYMAFFGGYRFGEGWLAWLLYAGLFVAVYAAARDGGARRAILDAMLLGAVVPLAYAIQQRLGYEVFNVFAADAKRPHTTLGDPNLAGLYFAALFPLSIYRAWLARRSRGAIAAWACLAMALLLGVGLTQSRAGLLGVLVAATCVLVLVSARLKWRRLFLAALSSIVGVGVLFVVLNGLPAVRDVTADVPGLGQLLLPRDIDDPRVSKDSPGASVISRWARWQAGVETYRHLTLFQQAVGVGGDSGVLHFFPHFPAALIRIEGAHEYYSFDRLHSDILDMAVNAGALGYLAYVGFVATLLHAAVRALFGVAERGSAATWGLPLAGGGLLAGLAHAGDFLPAVVPAFALGLGFGWLAYFAWLAWRTMATDPPKVAVSSERYFAIGALVAAFVPFWFVMQFGYATVATRVLFFGIAGLLLATANDRDSPGESGSAAESAETACKWPGLWACSVGLVVACASFWTPVVHDRFPLRPGFDAAWLFMMPAAPLVVLAMLYGLSSRGGEGLYGPKGKWLLLVVPVVAYGSLHGLLRVDLTAGLPWSAPEQLTWLSLLLPACLVLMCFASAGIGRGVAAGDASALLSGSRLAWGVGLLICGLALSGVKLRWQALAEHAWTLADVARIEDDLERQEAFLKRAVELAPAERHFRRYLSLNQSEQAALAIGRGEVRGGQGLALLRKLEDAEQSARAYVARYPNDPWAYHALGMATTLRAIPLLRSLDPAGGARAAAETMASFDRGHDLYPVQPVFLKFLAISKAGTGLILEACSLLREAASLAPQDPEPYQLCITFARAAGDWSTVFSVLNRARGHLAPDAYRSLEEVANMQHKN